MINYYLLTKPGIIFGNLVTLAAGFLLASRGEIELSRFLGALLGLGFVIASACVFNNMIDRNIDKKMERTKNRPLVQGLISSKSAILFASALALIGGTILYVYTNPLALFISSIGFFIYVVLYSLWKSKTIYGTAIGSIAGAIPPVVGYCAVSNRFDLGAFLLFTMLIFWQMPHFFSVALMHLNDYRAAQIPLLPIEKGIWRTKVHMVIYILCFIAASAALPLFHYTGVLYLSITILLGFAWLILCLKGFSNIDEKQWSTSMFRLSLIIIMALSFTIPFDTPTA